MNLMFFEIVNLKERSHKLAIVDLLNDYMRDDMGGQKCFDASMHLKVLNDLEAHPSYTGFLLRRDATFVALANGFVNYSTFKAKHLLNIHDFIVAQGERRRGYGEELMQEIIAYSQQQNYCRINLEVREDNVKARALYQKIGFEPCQPNMLFWEKNL